MLTNYYNRVTTTLANTGTALTGESRDVSAPQEAIAAVLDFSRRSQRTPAGSGPVAVACRATTTIVEERPLWIEGSTGMERVPDAPADPQTLLARQNYELTRKWATSERLAYTVWFPHVNPDGEVVEGGLTGITFPSETEAVDYADAAVNRGTHVIGSVHATNRRGRRTGPDQPMEMAVKGIIKLETTRTLLLAEAQAPHRVRILGVPTPFTRRPEPTIA